MMVAGARRFQGSGPAFALAGVAIPFFFYGLGNYSVVNGDEAIYHAIAGHMLDSGDWITLVFRGTVRDYDTFMSAPLQYWTRGALIAWFGDGLFAMRALSAAMGVVVVWATWRLGAVVADRRTAWIAGVAQLTTFQFVYLHGARTGELETSVAALMTLSALFLARALIEGHGFAPHLLCVALLMNVKSPTALIPLLAGAAMFGLIPASRARLREYLGNAALILPFGAVWHITRALADPDAFFSVAGAMLQEASGADADSRGAGAIGNLWFYAKVLAFGAFPWSILYPLACGALFARLRRGDLGVGIACCFALSVALFYVLVGKSFPWYITPLYPFLSIGVGLWLADLSRRSLGSRDIALVSLAGALAIAIVAGDSSYNPFAEQARRIAMELSWRFGAVAGPLLAVACALGFAIALRTIGARTRSTRVFVPAVALGTLLIACAGFRVAAPLAYIDHESEIARLHRELRDARASGAKIDWPIQVPGSPAPVWIARYYFGEDYEMGRARAAGNRTLWLSGPTDAR